MISSLLEMIVNERAPVCSPLNRDPGSKCYYGIWLERLSIFFNNKEVGIFYDLNSS